MNTYSYVQQNGIELGKAIMTAAPSWAAEYCLRDQNYLNYEDTDPPAAYCASCLHLPTLEHAIADFELVFKLGGLDKAKDKILYAKENDHETISVPVVIDGEKGLGCLYIDTLEKAVTRIKQNLSAGANTEAPLSDSQKPQFKVDDVVVPIVDHWGKSPNAVTVVAIDGEFDFKGRNATGLEREFWYATSEWRLATDQEKKWMCRINVSE